MCLSETTIGSPTAWASKLAEGAAWHSKLRSPPPSLRSPIHTVIFVRGRRSAPGLQRRSHFIGQPLLCHYAVELYTDVRSHGNTADVTTFLPIVRIETQASSWYYPALCNVTLRSVSGIRNGALRLLLLAEINNYASVVDLIFPFLFILRVRYPACNRTCQTHY